MLIYSFTKTPVSDYSQVDNVVFDEEDIHAALTEIEQHEQGYCLFRIQGGVATLHHYRFPIQVYWYILIGWKQRINIPNTEFLLRTLIVSNNHEEHTGINRIRVDLLKQYICQAKSVEADGLNHVEGENAITSDTRTRLDDLKNRIMQHHQQRNKSANLEQKWTIDQLFINHQLAMLNLKKSDLQKILTRYNREQKHYSQLSDYINKIDEEIHQLTTSPEKFLQECRQKAEQQFVQINYFPKIPNQKGKSCYISCVLNMLCCIPYEFDENLFPHLNAFLQNVRDSNRNNNQPQNLTHETLKNILKEMRNVVILFGDQDSRLVQAISPDGTCLTMEDTAEFLQIINQTFSLTYNLLLHTNFIRSVIKHDDRLLEVQEYYQALDELVSNKQITPEEAEYYKTIGQKFDAFIKSTNYETCSYLNPWYPSSDYEDVARLPNWVSTDASLLVGTPMRMKRIIQELNNTDYLCIINKKNQTTNVLGQTTFTRRPVAIDGVIEQVNNGQRYKYEPYCLVVHCNGNHYYSCHKVDGGWKKCDDMGFYGHDTIYPTLKDIDGLLTRHHISYIVYKRTE